MTRWRILSLLFLARTGLGVQFQTVGSVGDHLADAFGFDYAAIGLLIGLFMAPGLFLMLPAGALGRLFSDRVLAGTGFALLALGSVIASITHDPIVFGFGRVVAGTRSLLGMLYLSKMVFDWFAGREIATAMSLFVMSWPLGIAMGQIGHAWLAQAYGWQAPFQVASVYCLFAAVAVLALYRPPHDLPSVNAGVGAALTGREWLLVLCAGCAWGVFNAAYVIYLSFGPKVLESLGQSTITSAGIISIGSWIMILSGAVCGQIVDRIGGRTVVLTLCMTGAVVSLLLLGRPGAGVGASLLFGLIGMAPAGVIMAVAGLAIRQEVRAFGMGIFFTVYYAIMLVTPPAAGAILDATGNVQGPIWLAGTLFILVVPIALMFQHLRSAPLTSPKRKV